MAASKIVIESDGAEKEFDLELSFTNGIVSSKKIKIKLNYGV